MLKYGHRGLPWEETSQTQDSHSEQVRKTRGQWDGAWSGDRIPPMYTETATVGDRNGAGMSVIQT